MANSLDPDQARGFVGPDLGPICLQMFSADDTSRLKLRLQNSKRRSDGHGTSKHAWWSRFSQNEDLILKTNTPWKQ